MAITHIVTHTGAAHRDDFLAVAVALAYNSKRSIFRPGITVHRRPPADFEIKDPEVWVLDQGQQHNPELGQFDHHQFERDHVPACALTLVLMTVLNDEQRKYMYKALPWLEYTERLDSKGPTQTAGWLGLEKPDDLRKVQSPQESMLLRRFAQLDRIEPRTVMHGLLIEQGDDILDQIQAYVDAQPKLDSQVTLHKLERTDQTWADLRQLDPVPRNALDDWLNAHHPVPTITVSRDNRGDGFRLFRRNDAPGVDFFRLKDHRDIEFAHPGGFICTTNDADCMVVPLMTIASDELWYTSQVAAETALANARHNLQQARGVIAGIKQRAEVSGEDLTDEQDAADRALEQAANTHNRVNEAYRLTLTRLEQD